MDKLKQLRWIIYARKSEDDKDKQIQSNQGQIEDLNAMIQRIGGLKIVDIINEEQSAKEPGRPKFNNMIYRIKKGEADGILAWAYHRLSRNPVDDGTIQWLLQQGVIHAIKTIDKVYLPGDNALLLRIEGGTANQFILDLKKNVRRGLKQKLQKGWKPSKAPVGYLNTKTEIRGENYIMKDPERFNLMRKAWGLMLTGQYTPSVILTIMNKEWGFTTRKTKRQGGKALSKSALYRIFSDPFYAGLFYYKNELHQGKHEAMITTDEFDRVQLLLGRKGNPRPKKHCFTYTGTMRCAVCGSAITASEKTKLIKSTGELKSYLFYHCTRRKKTDTPCNQKGWLRVEALEDMISNELSTSTITKELKDWAIDVIEEEYGSEIENKLSIVQSQEATIQKVQKELDNLTHLRLRDLITDDEFILHKKSLQIQITMLQQKVLEAKQNAFDWQQFLINKFEFVYQAKKRFENGTMQERKQIFLALGRNYTLKDKKLFIDKHKWLESIIEIQKELSDEKEWLEPSKNIENKGLNSHFDHLRPLLCGLINEVRTRPEKYNAPCQIKSLAPPTEHPCSIAA